MKIQSSFIPTFGCKNVWLSLTLSIGLSMAAAEAQIFTDDFASSHLYWQEFGTVDVTGTIWDGVQGESAPDFARVIDANQSNLGQLTIGVFDEPSSNGTSGSPFDVAALYREVTGDFDAKVEMPVVLPDTKYLSHALAAWNAADLTQAIHVDNLRGTTNDLRFRDSLGPDEFVGEEGPAQWIRLQRNGNTFTGFFGSDGVIWEEIGAFDRDYGPTLRVGLSAWNFNPVAFDAVFDNFSIDLSDIADPTGFEWQQPGLGDWNEPTNWSVGGPPNLNTSTAVFGGLVDEPTLVGTNTDVTVKAIQFANTNSYVIGGVGTVTLDADTDNASISVTGDADAGDHQFQASVSLSDTTDVDVGNGASLSFNNVLNLNGSALNKTGLGTMNVNNLLTTGAGGSINCNEGVCGGNGTVNGNLDNAGGTVSPGNSPGVMEVDGVYSQGAAGTLLIEIGGTESGIMHDLFQVTGTAQLAGTLEVALIDGFQPAAGDTFDILDFGDFLGGFDEVSLPALASGLAWDDVALYENGRLSVVPEPSSLALMLLACVAARIKRSRCVR